MCFSVGINAVRTEIVAVSLRPLNPELMYGRKMRKKFGSTLAMFRAIKYAFNSDGNETLLYNSMKKLSIIIIIFFKDTGDSVRMKWTTKRMHYTLTVEMLVFRWSKNEKLKIGLCIPNTKDEWKYTLLRHMDYKPRDRRPSLFATEWLLFFLLQSEIYHFSKETKNENN